MSTLTSEYLLQTMRELHEKYPPPPRNPLALSPFIRPLGMDVIVEPDVPVLQLSKGCAELVGPEFAASVNAWLIARFGFREPIAKTPLMLYGTTLMVNRRDYASLLRATCS